MCFILFAAKLMALIGVKCDYPRTPTVFCLQLNWHGEHDAGNNDAIRVSYLHFRSHKCSNVASKLPSS
jgi:hypothetical protein